MNLRALFLAIMTSLLITGIVHADSGSKGVYVNKVKLSEAQVRLTERTYNTVIQNGYYWYDRMTGLYGLEGGPPMGIMQAGMNIGGTLRSDASNGNTGVFINGREAHMVEVQYLKSVFGYVYQGRYWLNSRGVGGFEGGPPLFSVNLYGQSANRGGGSGGSYIRETPGGTIGGDGNTFYFNDPNGGSVIIGD